MKAGKPNPTIDQLEPACLADGKTKIRHKMIVERSKAIGKKLRDKYSGKPITVMPIMNGAFVFANDVFRHLHENDHSVFTSVMLQPVLAKSYKGARQGDFDFRSLGADDIHIRDRNVILIDDIVDTGRTLNVVQAFLGSHSPADVTCVVMCRKPAKDGLARLLTPIEDEFVGLEIEDEFVVGYGLDFNERYRELPTIKKFKKGTVEKG